MSSFQNIREYLEEFLLYKHKLGYIYDKIGRAHV